MNIVYHFSMQLYFFFQNLMLRIVTEVGISQAHHNRQIKSLLQFHCLIRSLLQGSSLDATCWKSLGVCKICNLFRHMISMNRLSTQ